MAEPEVTKLRDVPIGIAATGARMERDSMGEIAVPAEHYWGAQTARALIHFDIGTEGLPAELHHAYGIIKRAAAEVNAERGALPADKAAAIIRAADEIAAGALDAEFPLRIWQTGSGTQTNMNVNEVIANRAIQLLGGTIGSKHPVHPNDDVNLAQSSNDTFPTAMHVATALALHRQVRPAIIALAGTIEHKSADWMEVPKIGRTHLMDAVPLTVGQEWSGWAAQLRAAVAVLDANSTGLFELAAGGTAVGTGLNAPPGFSRAIAARIADLTGLPFRTAPNKFAALAGLEAVAAAMAGLRGIAIVLIKIANDLRWLGSGPRCGFCELRLPENEPGSSIMPGKVNPTQCEAIVMIGTQVLGLDAAVASAASEGNFQLNVMRPVVIHNVLTACRIIAEGANTFRIHTVEGVEINRERIAELLARSLMLVTSLSPIIGYDQAARIAHDAHHRGITLREAALASGLIDAETFDKVVDPGAMTGQGIAGA